MCQHYIRWNNIHKMSKKTDEFNQAIFDFVKQYLKISESGDYLCKSCNESVYIQKYVFETTHVEELDFLLTTSMFVHQNLEDIPKYKKYIRTIRNLEKNIEKFAYTMDLMAYIGNNVIIRNRRKMVIKDIIDLVLVHTEWLRAQTKDRIEIYSKKFGIIKEFTNLFFFELKDEIFLTSSTDTDYYKLIKYNNIMIYLLFFIIIELNPGQILSLREDKRFNFFLFNKVSGILFSNLFIRISQKELISLEKIPLLAYLLYYFSGIMVMNRFWLYNDSDIKDAKKKLILQLNMQKVVIHTTVDLFNTITDAKYSENKNYLYDIIGARISNKIHNLFNDTQLLKRLEIQSTKYIKEVDNRIVITRPSIDFIELNTEFKTIDYVKERCETSLHILDKKEKEETKNTHCPDGHLHSWEFKNNELVCKLCNQNFNEVNKKEDKSYIHKMRNIILTKLSKKYCLSGSLHDLDSNGKCSKCNININTYNPSNKELDELEKNIEKKQNEITIQKFNEMKKSYEKKKEESENENNIVNKVFKYYREITEDKLENYVLDFIDKLSNILGNKIKVDGKTIYIKETIYILDHNYLGNPLKEKLTILTSDNKILLSKNHKSFNKDIIYYRDNVNKVYVYYDAITLQYLGYSSDNTNIKKIKVNAALIIELSLKDNLMFLGYENPYYNIYHLNKDYLKKLPTELGDDSREIAINIIRDRIKNLKQLIIRAQSIIHNVRNTGKIKSIHNIEEKKIIDEFTKKIKNYKVSDEENNNVIFKHHNIVLNKIFVNYDIPSDLNIKLNQNYINLNTINNLNNSDNVLIFYLVFHFNRLLDYNKKNIIEAELAHMCIKIIKFLFNLYYKPYSNFYIRRFDSILLIESPNIDETLKGVGHYQELLTQEEIDDPERKEKEYSNKEENDALDVESYDNEDDQAEAYETGEVDDISNV